MKQLVIGAGEVGTAIAAVLGDAQLRDMDDVELERVDVLHVCFPWTPAFEDAVIAYRARYDADLVVIHSTVPVGTSRRVDAVHSPVTGRHPDLEVSLRTFTKFFGGDQSGVAASIFSRRGVATRCVSDQETTEAGKLWQTLQFGWLVALQKEGYRFFAENGADPEVAYRAMNEAYSAGYEALGEPFRLPIMADVPGQIGGHCVIQNTDLTPAPLAALLQAANATW